MQPCRLACSRARTGAEQHSLHLAPTDALTIHAAALRARPAPAAYVNRMVDLAHEWSADVDAPMKLMYILSHRCAPGPAPLQRACPLALHQACMPRQRCRHAPMSPIQVLGGGTAHAWGGGAEAR